MVAVVCQFFNQFYEELVLKDKDLYSQVDLHMEHFNVPQIFV